MSLKRALAKLPPNVPRRGILIAIEGPVFCNSDETVNKILDELDDPLCIVNPWQNGCISPGQKSNTENETEFFSVITRIKRIQPEILQAIDSGRNVIVYNYMIHAIVHGILAGINRADQVQNVAAVRIIGRYLEGVLLPDRNFLFTPTIEVYSKRVEENTCISQDDYMFSDYRREVDLHLTVSDYFDRVCCFSNNPITMESDLLNMIVMQSVTNGHDKKRFYYV
jgi:hypothetical protein